MSKGQKRSNREIKKPKANKKIVAVVPSGKAGATPQRPSTVVEARPKKV